VPPMRAFMLLRLRSAPPLALCSSALACSSACAHVRIAFRRCKPAPPACLAWIECLLACSADAQCVGRAADLFVRITEEGSSAAAAGRDGAAAAAEQGKGGRNWLQTLFNL
jgi:hypothetical protein